MKEYWNDPDATANALRDGWLFTGDLGTCDADGFFKIVDRKKDLIITSGFNVYPTDVEHVLRKYDGVEDVVVLGIPDGERGELVKAVVVAKDGQRFSQRAFHEFAREHLEVHKRPEAGGGGSRSASPQRARQGPAPRPPGPAPRRCISRRQRHLKAGKPNAA